MTISNRFDRFARGLAAASIGLSLAACDRAPEQTASVPELRAEACRDFGQVISYASAIAPAAQESSMIPPSGLSLASDLAPVSGILVSDSSFLALDLALGQLVRLDREGRVIMRAGRTGRGPGEFNPLPGMESGDFMGAHGDTLVVWDGRSVHRFYVDGRHISSKPVPAVARPFIEVPKRMRVDGGVAYIESTRSMDRNGGGMSALPNRYFHVWRMQGDSVETVAVLELPQLPRIGNGGFFGSPAEARPTWDLRAGCLALMDGSTARLILVDVRSGARDTLALPLPERFADAEAINANLPRDMMPDPSLELPKPALVARFTDLRLAPDGWLWLDPVITGSHDAGMGLATPSGGGIGRREVWRYHLTTGQFSTDTVGGFPRGFSQSGTPFRTETDDEGVTRIYALEQPLR